MDTREVTKAYRFAEEKHRGQLDKAGQPYIFHLARVADRVMQCSDTTEYAVQVALLHDTLEDTDTTLLELINNFGGFVAQSVLTLTREEGEKQSMNPDEYYIQVAKGHTTRIVKLADMEDNLNEDRLSLLDEKTQERLRRKYRPRRKYLLSVHSSWGHTW